MIVSDNVRIAEGIAHKAPEILASIKKKKKPSYRFWYGVTTGLGPESLMYIISSEEYLLPVYRDDSLKLLGLAGSRQEACEIVTGIVKEGCDAHRISDMKQFIEEIY